MSLTFTKMHALGNDYVYVDLSKQSVADPEGLARAISDRHRGVGSDGLILIAPVAATGAHVRMTVHNADGSRALMCGNGARCVAKYAYEHGLAHENPVKIITDGGVVSAHLVTDAADRVTEARVSMGEPILDPRSIPVRIGGEHAISTLIEACGKQFAMTCVSMGNPHAVVFRQQLEGVPLDEWGPAFEQHPLFPERTNVHFARILSRDSVAMITWERGSGITQACGSGACAVCVAGVLNKLLDRKATVMLPGGRLMIEWEENTNEVYMTGPATEVFTGAWPM